MGAKKRSKPRVPTFECVGVPGEPCGRSTNKPEAFLWKQDSDGTWRCPRCMRVVTAEAHLVAVAAAVVTLRKIREPLVMLLRAIDFVVHSKS
jgi:hypothetical protein